MSTVSRHFCSNMKLCLKGQHPKQHRLLLFQHRLSHRRFLKRIYKAGIAIKPSVAAATRLCFVALVKHAIAVGPDWKPSRRWQSCTLRTYYLTKIRCHGTEKPFARLTVPSHVQHGSRDSTIH